MESLLQYIAEYNLLDSARILDCRDQIQQQDDIQQVDDAALLLSCWLLRGWRGAAHVAEHRIKEVYACVAVNPEQKQLLEPRNLLPDLRVVQCVAADTLLNEL